MKCMKASLSVMNPTSFVGGNKAWKKFQARTGFEPMTSAIQVQRSTDWANKPTES